MKDRLHLIDDENPERKGGLKREHLEMARDYVFEKAATIEKFPKEFKELYEINPLAHHIVECLSRGMSPYEAITIVLKQNQEYLEYVKKLHEYQPAPRIILTNNEEEYNRLIEKAELYRDRLKPEV